MIHQIIFSLQILDSLHTSQTIFIMWGLLENLFEAMVNGHI